MLFIHVKAASAETTQRGNMNQPPLKTHLPPTMTSIAPTSMMRGSTSCTRETPRLPRPPFIPR